MGGLFGAGWVRLQRLLSCGAVAAGTRRGGRANDSRHQAVDFEIGLDTASVSATKRVPDLGVRPRELCWIAAVALVCLTPWHSVAAPAVESARSHWALQPLRSVVIPETRPRRLAGNEVDAFVLQQLKRKDLSPSPAVERRQLIRRASFDLLGLPPTPEEVEQFVADPDPKAYPRLLDRLLRSPHYGERWGRHWLDVARYADNKGYVFFEEKTYPWAYAYRDYVVRAFNEDLPIDRFIVEQLAADQLDLGADRRPLAAMGFLTVGDHLVNNTHDIVDDRIDVLSRGILGMTVACARCHDHKFDPILQTDYYALYGVLRSSYEPMVPPLFSTPRLAESYEEFELGLVAREEKLKVFIVEKHGEIVRGGRRRLAEYLMAAYAARNQPPTENFMVLADKEDINPTVLLRWRLALERAREQGGGMWAPWHAYAALSETNFAQEAAAPPSKPAGSNSVPSLVAKLFQGQPPKSMQEVADRYQTLLRGIGEQWELGVEDARKRGLPAPQALPDAEREALRAVLYGPDAPPDVPATMDWGFLSLLPDRASQGVYQQLVTDLEQWLMRSDDAPPRAMVLQDSPVAFTARVFQRGNPNRPGAEVPRRLPLMLDPTGTPFKQGSGRLELARALTSRRTPVTARVFVNRVWMHHFGAGLVTTPGDFGMRSEPPSHPDLLEYLTWEFVQHGWSLKWLHTLMMESATYQQSSLDREEGVRVDPENRLLWKMPRRRHDFETLRDSVLAVSGQLDATLGGRPVGLTAPRRSLYLFVDRMDLPSLYTTFDFPSPSSSCSQRSATTVSPQSLYLMNNEFVAQAARSVLKRPDVASLSDGQRLGRLHQLFFGRSPREEEIRHARSFLARPGSDRWGHYVHALLMSNEFVFVD